MADLSMDRVREIAEYIERLAGYESVIGMEMPTLGETCLLAQMVLALTAQRDEAVAGSREAVDELEALGEGGRSYDYAQVTRLRAALTTPTGGTDGQ